MYFNQINFSSPAFMAPMAGYTDRAFRKLLKGFGASLLFGEFVSADGLIRQNVKTLSFIRFDQDERPFGIQIFGSDPEAMVDAAQIVETYRPDLIDLNFGCPVQKVVKIGAGAALLRDLDKMEAVAGSVVKSVSIPVTAKIRSGWDSSHIVAVEATKRLEASGVQAVSVHPRTREMGYSGKADWQVIASVKRSVTIPVIGNGDIWHPEDALKMMQETGCDYVMVARGALRSPWIFRQIKELLLNNKPVYQPTTQDWLSMVRKHIHLSCLYNTETRTIKEIRKYLSAYIKGKPGASTIRNRIHHTRSIQEIETALEEYCDHLKK